MLVTGYWNVFEDDTFAHASFTAAGRRSTHWLTEDVNRVLRDSARRAGAAYVDLGPVFARPTGSDDLLAAHGDHPDAAGHAAIARALLDARLHSDG